MRKALKETLKIAKIERVSIGITTNKRNKPGKYYVDFYVLSMSFDPADPSNPKQWHAIVIHNIADVPRFVGRNECVFIKTYFIPLAKEIGEILPFLDENSRKVVIHPRLCKGARIRCRAWEKVLNNWSPNTVYNSVVRMQWASSTGVKALCVGHTLKGPYKSGIMFVTLCIQIGYVYKGIPNVLELWNERADVFSSRSSWAKARAKK